ncbi:MAG TPA: SRPBCC family protein [Candidatus Omnitrophota bacterium]|nr:SRPBCC family protein [Candidatus Omnitrophota bacterium]HPD85525.1 SRPBCC family protein [Candidatus Omnitrophota bacterium]HRZ04435.1 SRPBCC family protein [Candidatus Omnitrophota bacterium]
MFKKTKHDNINHHFVFIEVPESIVAPEVILWGESSWWPKKCAMKFTRLTEGELRVGTQFEQKVLLPLGPHWKVEVTKLVPNREIERTFLDGMFKGKEWVVIDERLNGTRVDYYMDCQIQGIVNKILWPVLFKKLHDSNIKMILAALRDYAVKKEKELKEQ